MKATYISRENDDVKFDMSFDAQEFDDAQIDVYKRTKGKFTVDGFRPGKVPRKIIEQRYGEGVFMEEAIDDLLNTSYAKALRELDIRPIDQPRIEFSKVSKGEPFTATVTVATPPEFEVKDYEGVKIHEVRYYVTDDDVEESLKEAQRSRSRLVDKDGAAENGDMVNIDYKGSKDGIPFDGGAAEGQSLKLGSGSFIPGFEDQLIGAKAGDEREVRVTFPEEYHADELAGQEAVFAVKINGVKAEELPELDDEFASDISEFDTLDEFKADIRAKLEEQNERRAEAEKKNAALEAVYEANDIEIPEVMVESEKDSMIQEFESRLRQQGMDMEQYMKYTGEDVKDFREKQTGDAEKRVKMRLIISAIAKDQGFEAAEHEVDAELEKMAGMYGMGADNLREVLGVDQLDTLRDDIRNRKAVDYIYESAVVEEER
ncbi:MAG: trigger factor [Clostridiales Family XIII bacterium]|jgi:trigger factor|nr:trigger factor [Clostridiales Family XIII bacterium]